MSARRAGLPVSEDDVQATVIEALRYHGFLATHFRPAKTEKGWRTPLEGDRGFPDVIGSLAGLTMALEIKSATGRVALEQQAWGREIAGSGRAGRIVWRLVRPDSLDEILAEIRDAAAGRRR